MKRLFQLLRVPVADFARIAFLGVLGQLVGSGFSGNHNALWSLNGVPFNFLRTTLLLDPVSGRATPGPVELDAASLALNLAVVVVVAWVWPWVVGRCIFHDCRARIIEPFSFGLLVLVNLSVILRSQAAIAHAVLPQFPYGFPYRGEPIGGWYVGHGAVGLNFLLVVAVAGFVQLGCRALARRRGDLPHATAPGRAG